jgi:hypothetical protein
MPKKLISMFLIFGAFFFITVGDRFLPKPFNNYSQSSRHKLNQMILGLFPDKDPQRPSKQREQEVEEFHRRANPKTNQE